MAVTLKQAKEVFGDRAFKQIEKQYNPKPKKNTSSKIKSVSIHQHNPAEIQLELLLRGVFGPDFTILPQAKNLIPGRRFVADFYCPELKTVFEMDGYGPHKSLENFKHDRERDQIFTLNGFTMLRFFYAQVMNDRKAIETMKLLNKYKKIKEMGK